MALDSTTLHFPLVKTWRGRTEQINQANPLILVCTAPPDKTLNGALYIEAQIHAAPAPAGSLTPLALKRMNLPEGAAATLEFTSAEMNLALGRRAHRDFVLLVRVVNPGSPVKQETYDLWTLRMMAHPSSEITPEPPALPSYPPASDVLAAIAAAAEALAKAEEALAHAGGEPPDLTALEEALADAAAAAQAANTKAVELNILYGLLTAGSFHVPVSGNPVTLNAESTNNSLQRVLRCTHAGSFDIHVAPGMAAGTRWELYAADAAGKGTVREVNGYTIEGLRRSTAERYDRMYIEVVSPGVLQILGGVED